MRKLFLILLFVQKVSAYTSTNAIDCTEFAITNALAAGHLVTNQLIIIGAGTATINTAIIIPKYCTLRGSGTNTTHLIGGVGKPYIFNFTGTGANMTGETVVSDMDLTCNLAMSTGFISVGNNVGTVFPGSFRISRCIVRNIQYHGISVGYGDSRGVIDHCTFLTTNSPSTQFNAFVVGGNEYTSWNNPNPLGTTNCVTVEDCYFYNGAGNLGNGHWDMYDGAQATVRYNLVDGSAATGTHGYDSQVTGTRTYELYANVFTNQSSSFVISETRSGIFNSYSNIIWGATMPTNAVMFLNYYRSAFWSYQSGLGYPGFNLTNYYSGNVLAATATTITAGTSNGFFTYLNGARGKQLKIVSGTGAGQSFGVSGNNATPPIGNGVITITNGTFSPIPDTTSIFALDFRDGFGVNIGNAHPTYVPKLVLDNVVGHFQMDTNFGLAGSLTNLYRCILRDPAWAGISYAAITTNSATGRNLDFLPVYQGTNFIALTNILDGTNILGYPGAFQEGMLNITQFTNSGVVMHPCYSKGNLLNGTNVGFVLRWTAATAPSPGGYFNTNSVVAGRDYINDLLDPSYTPATYPHPLNVPFNDPLVTIASTTPVSGVSISTSADLHNVTSGLTPFTNNYIAGSVITLTAPPSVGAVIFNKWTATDTNGVTIDFSGTNVVTFTNRDTHKYTAVFGDAQLPAGTFNMRVLHAGGISKSQ